MVLDIYIHTYTYEIIFNFSLVAAILIYRQFPSYTITKDKKLICILCTQEMI